MAVHEDSVVYSGSDAMASAAFGLVAPGRRRYASADANADEDGEDEDEDGDRRQISWMFYPSSAHF